MRCNSFLIQESEDLLYCATELGMTIGLMKGIAAAMYNNNIHTVEYRQERIEDKENIKHSLQTVYVEDIDLLRDTDCFACQDSLEYGLAVIHFIDEKEDLKKNSYVEAYLALAEILRDCKTSNIKFPSLYSLLAWEVGSSDLEEKITSELIEALEFNDVKILSPRFFRGFTRYFNKITPRTLFVANLLIEHGFAEIDEDGSFVDESNKRVYNVRFTSSLDNSTIVGDFSRFVDEGICLTSKSLVEESHGKVKSNGTIFFSKSIKTMIEQYKQQSQINTF